MTDNRNTILAVILSGLVLIAWQYFYNMPQMERQRAQTQTQAELNKPSPQTAPGSTTPQPGSAPSATTPAGQPGAAAPVVSRDAAIAASPRIKIETPRVSGSIALKGARIDDLSLEKFRDTVDPKSPAIVLFSPSNTAHPYYAEFGWVAGLRLDGAASRPRYGVAAGGLGRAVAEQPGDAEIRQWRRPHLPPHHCGRRPLSLHRQGRRHQRRQCARSRSIRSP